MKIKAVGSTLEEKAEWFLTQLTRYFIMPPADGSIIDYIVYKGNPDLSKRYYDNPRVADGTFYYDAAYSAPFKPIERGVEALIGKRFWFFYLFFEQH